LESLLGQIENIVNNPIFAKYGLAGLFLNGVASSIIPIPTELTASALLLAGQSRESVMVVLTAGSIIGGFISYYAGYGGNKFFHRFVRQDKKQQVRGSGLLEKYGWIAIFLSPWIPIFGDVIPVIAGAKKFSFRKFTIAMVSGKTVKVIALVYISSWLLPLVFK